MALPWTALESLPLVQNMVPSRLAVFTALFAGLLLAAAVDGLWRLGGWAWRALAVLTAAVVLAALVPPEPFRAPPVLVVQDAGWLLRRARPGRRGPPRRPRPSPR